MEIHRKGSNSDALWTRIQTRKSKGQLFALSPGIMSPNTSISGPAVHVLHKRCKVSETGRERDYLIELDFSEIAELIDMLSEKGLEQYGEPLSRALSKSVRSLNRLMAAASGIPVGPEERDD